MAVGCADLARSVEFYRDVLGAELIARIDSVGLAFSQLGDTRLLVERADAPRAGDAVLYFDVSDIGEAYDTLRSRGVDFDHGPHLIHSDEAGTFGPAGEEEWMAFFRDPDNNILAVASRVPVSMEG